MRILASNHSHSDRSRTSPATDSASSLLQRGVTRLLAACERGEVDRTLSELVIIQAVCARHGELDLVQDLERYIREHVHG
jgi:hypothetical protein